MQTLDSPGNLSCGLSFEIFITLISLLDSAGSSIRDRKAYWLRVRSWLLGGRPKGCTKWDFVSEFQEYRKGLLDSKKAGKVKNPDCTADLLSFFRAWEQQDDGSLLARLENATSSSSHDSTFNGTSTDIGQLSPTPPTGDTTKTHPPTVNALHDLGKFKMQEASDILADAIFKAELVYKEAMDAFLQTAATIKAGPAQNSTPYKVNHEIIISDAEEALDRLRDVKSMKDGNWQNIRGRYNSQAGGASNSTPNFPIS